MPRVRRPLLALIALIAAVAVGYTVNALRHDDPGSARPTPSISSTPTTGVS